MVKLLDLMLWVGQRLGEFAIVTEDNEALGITIEPTDVHQVLHATRQEIVNGVTLVFVAAGADESGWFMEDDALDNKWLDPFSVSSDLVSGLDPVGGREARLSIDDDVSGENHGVTGTPRADPAGSKILIKTDTIAHCWIDSG